MADAPARPPLCALEDVSHTFVLPSGQRLEVLRDVSVEIRENEVVALLGPSGCGKSTILRILAGLIRPTRGTVRVRGEPLHGLAPGVAIVFQGFALFPWMTVVENVRVVLQAAGLRARGVGLAHRRGHPHGGPGRLRGGLPPRALRRHEAAGRHGPGALAPPRGALHGRALQPAGRADRRGAARRDPRHLGGPPPGPLGAAPRVARHQGGGDHGRPDRGPLRQPGPGAHRDGEPAAAPARRPLAGGAGAGRPAPRPHHRPRAARPPRAGRRRRRPPRRRRSCPRPRWAT